MVWKLFPTQFSTSVFEHEDTPSGMQGKTCKLVCVGVKNSTTKYETLVKVDGDWLKIYNEIKLKGSFEEISDGAKQEEYYPNILIYEVKENQTTFEELAKAYADFLSDRKQE